MHTKDLISLLKSIDPDGICPIVHKYSVTEDNHTPNKNIVLSKVSRDGDNVVMHYTINVAMLYK